MYVDDIVITGSDTLGISSLKSFLHTQFHTKALELLRYFLGVEVTRNKKGIFLSQRKYVLDLLTETGKLRAKPCSTPMLPKLQLTKDDKLFEDPERYRKLVGKLNYLKVTHPDIAYSISIVSQFMSSPTVNHWAALEYILCYLKGAHGLCILYKIMDTMALSVTWMQIGQIPRWIEDPLRVIVSLLEEIWSHGEVRSKILYLDRVQNQNIKLWHSLFVK